MKCDAVMSSALPRCESPVEIDSTQGKGFIFLEIENSYCEYFNGNTFLQECISSVKNELKEISGNGRDEFVKNNLIKKELEPIEKHKNILGSIVEEIELILGNSSLSIAERRDALRQVAIKIRACKSQVNMKGRNDQGKLEDVLTAGTATSTNLWKALIDSKILSTASFLYTCLPFWISLLPLSLRIAEYFSIQINKVWRNEFLVVSEIYSKLLEAIKVEIKILDERCQSSKLNNAKENKFENNSLEQGNGVDLNHSFIDAILQNPILKKELINKLAAEIININMAGEVPTPNSSLSNASTVNEVLILTA